MEQAARDLSHLRAIIASGVLGTGDVSWAAAAVCDRLEELLMGRKREIRERTERVTYNSVTHQLERTELDSVQKALDRVVQVIDGFMLNMASPERDRLARRILARVALMLPHTDGPDGIVVSPEKLGAVPLDDAPGAPESTNDVPMG